MNSESKQLRRVLGDIVEIDLGDDFHTHARVLEEALFASYDCRTKEDVATDLDALLPDQFRIYEKEKIRPATKQECIGLEREAGWDPTLVEDRLRDHYAGRRIKSVESLKIRE
jgi:hypothetical protein